MSYLVSDPALIPLAKPPPPLLKWAQANPILVTGAVVFWILESGKKKPRKRRRKRK